MHCHWVVFVVLSLLGWTVGDVMVSSRFSNADCTGAPTSVVARLNEEECVASSCFKMSRTISEKRECQEEQLNMPGYVRVEQYLSSPCTKENLDHYSFYDHTGSCYNLNGQYTLFQCDESGNVLAAQCLDSLCSTGCKFINAPDVSNCQYSNGSYVSIKCNTDMTKRKQLRDDLKNILFVSPTCVPLALTLTGTASPFGLALSPLLQNSLAQQWTIDGDGFIINGQQVDQALDIVGYSSIAGTPVGLWTKKVAGQTSANQQWTISQSAILSQLISGLYLTPVFTGSSNSGTLVVDYTSVGATIQNHDSSSNSGCSANALCRNVGTSNFCECKSGFTGDGSVCEDTNECSNSNICGANADCTNTPGSYSCACKSGYTLSGTVCTDTNECSNSNICGANADCTNTPGSYSCACKSGYILSGTVCIDKNECSTSNICGANADCTNTPGSYTCACKSGYTLSGTVCTDNNECSNSNICGANSICTNTPGSYTCACKAGYTLSGTVCTDINECSNSNICGANAYCTNTAGSYYCSCNSGYSGNPCTDINECSSSGICNTNAYCTNTPGSYYCSCNYGYQGNGLTCTANSCPPYTVVDPSSNTVGVIRSTRSGLSKYTPNTNCQWQLYGSEIYLRIEGVVTEASWDTVEVYAGDSTSDRRLARLSGTKTSFYNYECYDAMLIIFNSDANNEFSGFTATYTIYV